MTQQQFDDRMEELENARFEAEYWGYKDSLKQIEKQETELLTKFNLEKSKEFKKS